MVINFTVEKKTGKIINPTVDEKGSTASAEVGSCIASKIEGLALEGGLGDGIVIEGGRSNRIAGCTVRNLGGSGMVVRGGSDHAVESCDLHALGAAGIRLSGGDRATLTACGHRAINNHIFDVGRRQKTYAAGIHVGESHETAIGCRVAHNLIHDLPHAAVLYTGNDHVFEYNEICRVATRS